MFGKRAAGARSTQTQGTGRTSSGFGASLSRERAKLPAKKARITRINEDVWMGRRADIEGRGCDRERETGQESTRCPRKACSSQGSSGTGDVLRFSFHWPVDRYRGRPLTHHELPIVSSNTTSLDDDSLVTRIGRSVSSFFEAAIPGHPAYVKATTRPRAEPHGSARRWERTMVIEVRRRVFEFQLRERMNHEARTEARKRR